MPVKTPLGFLLFPSNQQVRSLLGGCGGVFFRESPFWLAFKGKPKGKAPFWGVRLKRQTPRSRFIQGIYGCFFLSAHQMASSFLGGFPLPQPQKGGILKKDRPTPTTNLGPLCHGLGSNLLKELLCEICRLEARSASCLLDSLFGETGRDRIPKSVELPLGSSLLLSELKARSPSCALSPPFLGEGSPTKIDYRKKGLILTSPLEDLDSWRILHQTQRPSLTAANT